MPRWMRDHKIKPLGRKPDWSLNADPPRHEAALPQVLRSDQFQRLAAKVTRRFLLGITSAALACSVQAAGATGSISGSIIYSSEDNPVMRICAIAADGRSFSHCVVTKFNQRRYLLAGLPSGKYYVIAYPKPPASWGIKEQWTLAYTRFVRCGMHVRCKDHSLIPIDVLAGRAVRGIDPADWGDQMRRTRFRPSRRGEQA